MINLIRQEPFSFNVFNLHSPATAGPQKLQNPVSYCEVIGMSTNRDVEEGFGLDVFGAFPSDSNAKAEKSKAKSTREQSRTRESDKGEEEAEGFGLDELEAQAPGITCCFTTSDSLAVFDDPG